MNTDHQRLEYPSPSGIRQSRNQPVTRTIQNWAKDAYDHVQFACNMSGLVFAFERCVADLAEEAARLGKDENWIDHHPVCVAWADKLDDLSGSRQLDLLPTGEHLTDLVPHFASKMREVCDEANRQGKGTDWRNQHPDVQQFVRKIVFLTRSREGLNVFNALDECERLSGEGAVA